MTFWGNIGDEGVRLADINGDGWIDLAQYFLDDTSYQGFDQNFIIFNNKTTGWGNDVQGYFPYYVVKLHSGWSEYWGMLLSDVDGDSRPDAVYARGTDRYTWLNKHPSWPGSLTWKMPDGNIANGSTTVVDINGDGLSDIVYGDGPVRWYRLNNGAGWDGPVDINVPCNLQDGSAQILDVNSDGLADIIKVTSSLKEGYTNNTQNWSRVPSWDPPDGDFTALGTRLADINGDGLVDILVYPEGQTPKVYLNNGPAPDLLAQIDNGIGSSISISYEKSTGFDNTNENGLSQLPFPINVVKEVTINDGQGNSYSTSYDYSKGLFDFETREFRGFGLVRTIDPDLNSVETYFMQDSIHKGKPYKQVTKDNLGNILSKSETLWHHDALYGGLVNFPHAREAFNYIYNGNSNDEEAFIKKTEVFNNYAFTNNILTESLTVEKGDVTIENDPIDDRKTITSYIFEESNWIVNLPKSVIIKDGSDNKISEKRFYYDDAAIDTPPVEGRLTKEEAWLKDPVSLNERYVGVTYAYNSFGQLSSTTDALGRTTSTTYEPGLNTYPHTITNALDHTLVSTYDPKTGQVISTTDPNNETTTNIYDSFGRLIKVIGPEDSETFPAVWYEYDLSSSPIKVTKHTKINYNDTPDYLVTYSFFDGLGRLIETKSPAENDPQTGAPRQIISGFTRYNNRGLAEEKYLPFFSEGENGDFVALDSNVPKATFTYDSLGRLITTANPDMTYSSVSYSGDLSITRTDENGHWKKEYYDVFGNLTQVEEYNNGATYTTAYEYDLLGNLKELTDNQGNITTISYDSFGRKISMNDPDMGEWSYDYDDAGNLIKQIDAKGQEISFNYDPINRLTSKLIGVAVVEYTFDDTTIAHSKGRLTQVDDPESITQFRYDRLGRETSSAKFIASSSFQVSRTYDALDRLTSVTYPDGETISYEYNKAGHIDKIAGKKGTETIEYVKNVDYNQNGQIIYIEYGNNTSTAYDYNPLTFRLSSFATWSGTQSRNIQNFSYQFDNAGNVTFITDSVNNSTQGFVYDDLDRLMQATGSAYGTINYAYDSIGNMTQKGALSMAYGENGAGPHAATTLISPTGAKNITYDENGNMISKGDKLFSYDKENRLIKAEVPGTQGSATVSINFSSGWNFFSLPVIPEDLSISAVLSSIDSSYDQVSAIDHTSLPYLTDQIAFKHYVKDAEFNDFAELEYGKGYQIYINDPDGCTLVLTGAVPQETQAVLLENRWNLVAAPTVASRNADDALKNLTYNIDYDYFTRYNKATQSFERYYANPAQNQFSQLEAGKAYYIYSKNGYDWQIAPETFATYFEYDGDGGRVKKITPTSTTTYVGSLFEKTDSLGGQSVQSKHIFMGSQRIASSKSVDNGPWKRSFFHSDHLGSSNVTTDQNGLQTALYEYKPYGETVEQAEPPQEGAFLEQGGFVVVEAEHYHANISAPDGHEWLMNNNHWGYSADGIMQALPDSETPVDDSGYTESSPRMDYRIHFNTTGTYLVWLRGYAQGWEERTVNVGLDGQAVATSDKMSGFSVNGFDWSKDTLDGQVATVYVTTAGEHVLNIWMREDGFYVDKVVLTTDLNYAEPDWKGPAESPKATVDSSSNETNYLFTGKELDPSTGLYFYGARYYDPEIGRFITADTIVPVPSDPQSLNRYSYCRNNPIKYIDPSGHWFWIAVIVGALLGGASAAANDQPIWQGMLMGAVGGLIVGVGAAAFGFWGAVGGGMISGASNSAVFGGNIGIGALLGGLGAGLGYGLGSWASGWNDFSFWGELGAAAVAGSVTGGVGAELQGGKFSRGALMGAAYGAAGFLGAKTINSNDPRIKHARARNKEARLRHALNSQKTDLIKLPVGRRPVSFFKPAGHQFLSEFEMGPDIFGRIQTSRTAGNLSKWSTHIETGNALTTGSAEYTVVEVSASGLIEAINWYEQSWVDTNTRYSGLSFNSNYAVNTVIYAGGGNVPNAPGWNPSFSNISSSVFYPYIHNE